MTERAEVAARTPGLDEADRLGSLNGLIALTYDHADYMEHYGEHFIGDQYAVARCLRQCAQTIGVALEREAELMREASRHRATVAALRKALEPFAAFIDAWEREHALDLLWERETKPLPDDETLDVIRTSTDQGLTTTTVVITAGDLRAARAALALRDPAGKET